MNNNWMLAIALIIMLPIALMTTIMPHLTRRIESFGVTIPENKQEDTRIRTLRGQYYWINVIVGILLTVSLLWLSSGEVNENRWSFILLAHVFGYLIISFGIYLRQHGAVKRLKREEKWMATPSQMVQVNTKFRQSKLTVSYLWFIPHLLLIVSSVLIGVLGYDDFPDRIAMHYDMNGEVDRYADKSYWTVLWPAFIQMFLLLVFAMVNYSIGRSKQIVEGNDPEGSLQRNIAFRRIWSGFMMVMGFLVMAMFSAVQLGMLKGWDPQSITYLTLGITGFILIGSISLSIITGQGGSRLKAGTGTKPGSSTSADHDRYWKLGQFYYNGNDPALFVEKRFGVGWTMNFARPLGWLMLLLIILIPVLIGLLVR
ncbi:DUF5808 domain-containing protein [Paenibacillus sp. HB172176]|uniref:DUF1648 domain-containing protein n=1 Tax=Paenibacillus sp. HB172176 TaxID=2493690 RepID=UPI00143941CC|nr:DUF5808 domain-containing protein [Paenibacillus sp. HB172176]